jgi:hypothetical protein
MALIQSAVIEISGCPIGGSAKRFPGMHYASNKSRLGAFWLTIHGLFTAQRYPKRWSSPTRQD